MVNLNGNLKELGKKTTYIIKGYERGRNCLLLVSEICDISEDKM